MSSSEVNHKLLEYLISSLSEFLFKQCKYHLVISTLTKVTGERAGCLQRAVSKRGNAKSTDFWFWLSQKWFGVSCHLLVRSPKWMQPSIRMFYGASCFHLLTSFQEMPISFSTCSQCQNYYQMICCLICYYCAWLASQLTWPEPHREYFKRKMRNTWPQNTEELRPAIKATWALITP